MSHLLSATPVRSNLASMLLQLKELPPDVVNDGLSRFVMLEQTPPFLRADPSFAACTPSADVTTFATSAFSFATGTKMIPGSVPMDNRVGAAVHPLSSSTPSVINPPTTVMDMPLRPRNFRGASEVRELRLSFIYFGSIFQYAVFFLLSIQDDPDLTPADETCNCRKSRCLKL
jgi:hypothetical protein